MLSYPTGLERGLTIWRKPRKVYKLVTPKLQTYGGYQWTLNRWKKVSGRGLLCSEGWLHCYAHPGLAVLLNEIHANFEKYYLFEAEAKGWVLNDSGLKYGVQYLRITKKIPKPRVNPLDFCLRLALEYYHQTVETEITDWLIQCVEQQKILDNNCLWRTNLHLLKGGVYGKFINNFVTSKVNLVQFAQNYFTPKGK